MDTAAELARIGARLVGDGLVVAAGGNLSARLERGDGVVVTAAGADLAALSERDFAVVDLDGARVDGPARPSSESSTHLAAYRARPDVRAVVHVHPPVATLLDALGRDIRLLTTDHAYYVGRVARVPYEHPGSVELAAAVAGCLTDPGIGVVLLGHHGCLTVGDSPQTAYRRAVNLEEAATATYRALLLGETAARPPQRMAEWVAAQRRGSGPADGA